jgi:hypothetical protein
MIKTGHMEKYGGRKRREEEGSVVSLPPERVVINRTA